MTEPAARAKLLTPWSRTRCIVSCNLKEAGDCETAGFSKSSANFRHCCMLVGGWPTSRRGLHGLDDPSRDRLPSALIGKALGCGCCADGAVWMLCQAAGKAQRSAGLQGPPATRRKARATSILRSQDPTALQISHRLGLPSRSSSLTSYIHCLSAASPSRHGIAIAGWGPRYFPVLLNLFLEMIFPGSLRSRGCVGAKPTWSTAHRPQPATDEPLGLPNHTPETAQPRFARTNDSGVPVRWVCSFAPRVVEEEKAVAISRWIQIPSGALDAAHPQQYCPLAAK